MSVLRGIATGYLGAKIADTEAADKLKGEVLESAGVDFYTNILPNQRSAEELRRNNYNTLAAEAPNLAELADINRFTASEEGMEKFEEFRKANRLISPDALKNLNFETDYNTRYAKRGKSFEEKYKPILDQIGLKEIGGLGYNTTETLIGNKEPGKMKQPDETQVGTQEFASTQLSDYFVPLSPTYQVPETEFARITSTMRNFGNVISFTPEGEVKFAFKGTKDIEYNALRAKTNDEALNFLDKDNKVNLSQAIPAASEGLYNQTQGIINAITDGYQEKTGASALQTMYTAQGFSSAFNEQYPTDKDKKEAIKSHLDSLGTMAEQKYFAISFPELVTFNDKQSVKDYLLRITRVKLPQQ